jgi:hypothetical protein
MPCWEFTHFIEHLGSFAIVPRKIGALFDVTGGDFVELVN